MRGRESIFLIIIFLTDNIKNVSNTVDSDSDANFAESAF